MEHCVDTVHTWRSSKRLQLYPSKSKIFDSGLEQPSNVLRTQTSVYMFGWIQSHPLMLCRRIYQVTSVSCFYGRHTNFNFTLLLIMRQHISKIVSVFLPSSTSYEGPADFRIQCNKCSHSWLHLLRVASITATCFLWAFCSKQSRHCNESRTWSAWLAESDRAVMWLHLYASSTSFQ